MRMSQISYKGDANYEHGFQSLLHSSHFRGLDECFEYNFGPKNMGFESKTL